MIYYRITDLLVFLEECWIEKCVPIEDIIEALNDFHLTGEERIQTVRAILRYHGLREITLDRAQVKTDEIIIEFFDFRGTINPIQLFDIHFRNGKIDFWQNLN